MTVKDFILAVAKTLGKSADKIAKAIMNAKLAGLIRFGILIGVSVVTVIAIFKFLKMKKQAYTDDSNKSVVDRALELNYSDIRNQAELHPLMKKVRKNLNKELKPRMKSGSSKKANKSREKYRKYVKDFDPEYTKDLRRTLKDIYDRDDFYNFDDDDDYDLMKDLEIFKLEMRDEDRRRERARRRPRTIDDWNLRTVWENS